MPFWSDKEILYVIEQKISSQVLIWINFAVGLSIFTSSTILNLLDGHGFGQGHTNSAGVNRT